MSTGIILVNSDLGTEAKLLAEIRTIGGVKEAYEVYGVYDIIARMEAESIEKLKELVQRVRSLDKVRSTLTMIVV